MSNKDDGGPAFPCEIRFTEKGIGFDGEECEENSTAFYSGVTVRDYFAAKAMQGILAGPCSRDGVPLSEWFDVPAHAYAIADAMLKAREA